MEGEYSKLEKDFLGNERMVHYNAENVAISASVVTRGADGSMTVGEPVPIVVKPEPEPAASGVVDARENDGRNRLPSGTLATIGIASFVVTALIALLLVNLNRPRDTEASRYNRAVYQSPVPRSESITPEETVPPPQELEPAPELPSEEMEIPPGDRKRPRILRDAEPSSVPTPDPQPETPTSGSEPVKPSTDDPIDLRGDDGRGEGDEPR